MELDPRNGDPYVTASIAEGQLTDMEIRPAPPTPEITQRINVLTIRFNDRNTRYGQVSVQRSLTLQGRPRSTLASRLFRQIRENQL